MPQILLVLGVLLAAIGVGAVLYGIPIHEFRFGDTLIISGTVSLTGGLILIGLALAVRQLRRIAETLDLQPMAWTAAPEATVQRPAHPAGPAGASEPAEPGASLEPALEPSIPAPEPVRAVPTPEPIRSADPVAMPEPRRSLRSWLGGARPIPPEALPQPAPVRASEPVRSSRVDLSALARVPEGPIDATTRARQAGDAAAPADRSRSFPSRRAAPPTAEEPAAATGDAEAGIYKSGVVEGMAYTLYTDGSIDAELPEGTTRFASLADLRAHLAARGQ